MFQVYMACQSMLIVLVGSTPEYRVEQQDGVTSDHHNRVVFTEDIDTIVTEVGVCVLGCLTRGGSY